MKKIALVTGAAKGVGKTIAQKLVQDGYTVVVHYFSSADDASKTVQSLQRTAPDSSMIQGNLRDATAAESMVSLVIERYGRIDLLVNNVGNFIYKPLAKTTLEEWNDVIETNLTATFLLCSLVLPSMRTQKSGVIINIGQVDAARMQIRPMTTPYAIAKTGILMLTKQLAFDNAKKGIRINAISPGIIETAKTKLQTPTETYISPDAIADAVSYLSGEQSTSVNGANLEVADGFTFFE